MTDLPQPRLEGPGSRAGESRHRRGPQRVRRGDVQAAVLALLAEADMHGYQIIQELAERSGGVWRPGAGSIYPTLRTLQEQGLIRSRSEGSRRVFQVTDYGRRTVTESGSAEPWKAYAQSQVASVKLQEATRSLLNALAQVEATGEDAQRQKAATIVGEARRAVYLMLAGDEA